MRVFFIVILLAAGKCFGQEVIAEVVELKPVEKKAEKTVQIVDYILDDKPVYKTIDACET